MNKLIPVLLIFLSIFIIDNTSAQKSKVDSLENVLKIHKTEDTTKVNLLNKIAYSSNQNPEKMRSYALESNELAKKIHFLKGNAESLWLIGMSYSKGNEGLTLEYIQKAIQMAREIGDQAGMARYLNWMGVTYKTQNKYERAIDCFKKSIQIYSGLNAKPETAKVWVNLSSVYRIGGNYGQAIDGYEHALKLYSELYNKLEITNCLSSLGVIYSYQSNFSQALENFQKYLKYKEDLNDKRGCATGLINIGNIYLAQTDYPKALELFQQALKITEEIDNKGMIATCLGNIGTTCQKMNNMQAITYLDRALSISESIKDKPLTVSLLIFIGDYYRIAGDFEKAMYNYSRCQKLSEEAGLKRQACEAISLTGAVYFLQKKYPAALNCTLKSLTLADELKSMEFQREIHKQLSDIYAGASDFKNALLHQKHYQTFKDSIFNEKNVKKMAELEYSYKFEKEKQAAELEQQKKDAVQVSEKKLHRFIIFSLTTAFILMCLLAVFLYRSYWFKHKTNIVLTKQKHDIEALNEEYMVLNKELMATNDELVMTKSLVEESEERLRLLIKNSNDILVLVNEKGEQFFISDAAKNLTGYHVEELFGSIENVVYPDDLEIVRQHWDRVLADKDTADCIQYRHKHKEKGYVWFETVSQNFLDHPAIKSVVANIRDVTERKNAEQALKEIEAEKARLMELEIERIARELEINQKSLTAASLKLIQNSERDAQTIERLLEIEKTTDPTGKQKINTLISDYKRLSYNSNWDEFEILFEKVHRSFYEKLNRQFPTLTVNERKICAFLRLNMSNKDIAQITFQSDEALKKARLRLRQKLEIERDTNLVNFLQNI